MQSRFSKITTHLQQGFPRWTKVRKDPNSVGAMFLNIFGLQFEDIEFYLQYALDNYFLPTADTKQIDIVYKSSLPPSLHPDDNIAFVGAGLRLNKMDSLKQFFEGVDSRFLQRKEVYYPNPYYIDWERHVVYFKKSYHPTDEFKEGKVELHLMNESNEVIFKHYLPQRIHHVWNFFDEFGLILDTPRLYGERNAKYKERLLDVFRHPANATKQGLEYLMARELNLWKDMKWYDGGVDYAIPYSNVIQSSIEVDGEKWPESAIKLDRSGRVVLSGNQYYDGQLRTVKCIAGIQLHTFHNHQDLAFQRQLYSIDRVATPMLRYYVDIITNQVPVMWDKFVWNESFWDVADEKMSGYGYIPSYTDGNFLNWLNYKK